MDRVDTLGAARIKERKRKKEKKPITIKMGWIRK